MLQLLLLTWLRPRPSWAVGLGSAASQGTQQLPHPWLLLSRPDRLCRWSFYGITRAQVSDRGSARRCSGEVPAGRVCSFGEFYRGVNRNHESVENLDW